MHLIIDRLTHRYPGESQPAVDDVSLALEPGEMLALIGGSGSGKSTLLRCIAGLETPTAATITLGGRCLTHPRPVPPEKRRIGMVSQSGDLFPHLTILRNVAFGLRHLPRRQRSQRALECLAYVGLENFSRRYPGELSGGEAQRVALARTLAFQPSLILLDEPFSNLDAALREQLRCLTLDLLRQHGMTSLFVTHHGDDALAGSDRIAVLRRGRLIQCDTPREIWSHPVDPEVAALFGGINLLPCAKSSRSGCYRTHELRPCGESSPDCLACGTVERIDYLGSHQLAMLRLPDTDSMLKIRVEVDTSIEIGNTIGIAKRGCP